eukprot:1161386-Pelagomonas_calceolata.AAC.11
MHHSTHNHHAFPGPMNWGLGGATSRPLRATGMHATRQHACPAAKIKAAGRRTLQHLGLPKWEHAHARRVPARCTAQAPLNLTSEILRDRVWPEGVEP